MIKEFIYFIANYIKEDTRNLKKPLIIFVFLLHIITNIPNLSYFYISIDDEIFAFNNPYKVWISIDRWTSALVNIFLFTHSTIPFLPFLFFSICISSAFIILSLSYNIKLNYYSLIHFLVFSIHPIWFFITIFDGIIPSVGLGLVFSSLSAYLFNIHIRSTNHELVKYKYIIVVLSSIFLSLSIGSYQSFLVFTSISYLFIMFTNLLENREHSKFLKDFYQCIIIIAIGLIIHLLMSQVFKLVFNVRTSEYLLSFIKINNAENLAKITQLIVSEIIQFYTGSDIKYGINLISLPILVLVSLVSLFYIIKNHIFTHKILLTLIFLVIIMSPFALILLGDFMPSRSLFPLANSFLAISIVASKIRVKTLSIIASTFLIFQSVLANSYYVAFSVIASQHDMLLASQIYNRIGLFDPHINRKDDIVINIFGRANFVQLAYRVPWSASMGVSFFDWDNGNMRRIVAYMRLMGYRVVGLPNSERQKYARYFEDMPVWPADGSIKKVDNVYLIKLSESPDLFHSNLK